MFWCNLVGRDGSVVVTVREGRMGKGQGGIREGKREEEMLKFPDDRPSASCDASLLSRSWCINCYDKDNNNNNNNLCHHCLSQSINARNRTLNRNFKQRINLQSTHANSASCPWRVEKWVVLALLWAESAERAWHICYSSDEVKVLEASHFSHEKSSCYNNHKTMVGGVGTLDPNFYRAKRSGARYCHDKLSVWPSVCPSVTLVDCDHTRWNSSKIISRMTDGRNWRGIYALLDISWRA